MDHNGNAPARGKKNKAQSTLTPFLVKKPRYEGEKSENSGSASAIENEIPM